MCVENVEAINLNHVDFYSFILFLKYIDLVQKQSAYIIFSEECHKAKLLILFTLLMNIA